MFDIILWKHAGLIYQVVSAEFTTKAQLLLFLYDFFSVIYLQIKTTFRTFFIVIKMGPQWV